jgi:protoheme IX farnesyltransferase
MNAWLALTKPRLTALSVMSGVAGFALGGWRKFVSVEVALDTFLWTLAGVCLIGAGANSLNMLMEKNHDALMDRTKNRPLPSQKLTWQQVLAFGMTFSFTGLFILSAFVNALAGWLALMTLITYVLVYTPLKRRSTFCTLVGALPGALPPLIGYAAASGRLDINAIYFFMILFLWQMPHFFALSWCYREDYRRAGFKMLCVDDDELGSMTARQTNMFVLFLLPVSIAPYVFGYCGLFYLFVASALGIGFLANTALLFKGVTDKSARRVFRYSVVYLSVIMLVMVLDHNISFDDLFKAILLS